MVSELAPVILFLKYLVRPGDLVILEEPESHLHPASQRQMARGIARLVNAGVRVIITTHSDYFIGQVNNLLKLSRASRQKAVPAGKSARKRAIRPRIA
jgi:predicted ATPase